MLLWRLHMCEYCKLMIFIQRRKKVTDDEVKAFMDANRQIVPTLGKKTNSE